MLGPLLGKGSWYSQHVQTSEQGEDAVSSLAAPELRVAFILNNDFFQHSRLKPTSAFIYVIAKQSVSSSFYFKHFN